MVDQCLRDIIIEFRQYLRSVLILDEASECLLSEKRYLFTCFFQQTIIVCNFFNDEAEETVHSFEVLTVSDALGFKYYETLEGVDNFLDELPGNVVTFGDFPIALQNFVKFFILLHECQYKVVGCFANFDLSHNYIEYLFVREADYHSAQLQRRLRYRQLVVCY